MYSSGVFGSLLRTQAPVGENPTQRPRGTWEKSGVVPFWMDSCMSRWRYSLIADAASSAVGALESV